MNPTLSADHEDSLKELLNISMGQAACKLATLLNHPVTLTIPSIDIASPGQLMEMFGDVKANYYTRQPFFGQMSGEVITQLTKQGGHTIASDLLALDDDQVIDSQTLHDSLLEVSNILSGASLRGLCEQIELDTRTQPPVMYSPARQPIPSNKWQQAIILHVSFLIESASFETKTIICFAEDGFNVIVNRLDEWL
ncbi:MULTISPECIES: chemotaxis protein CheC [Vibrio]|uniref:Chemotaxis protein CheC n=2 Tax=Vibrio TaxID=662 RepID=A0A178J9Y8_9VIBR|nr:MULTISPECIES: chemotaxis protein CheC [Vibrio]AIS58411.1 chemotaxis protein CheC [Vibrio coralliilyticus]AIW22748.1 chemotaxis protein CheC [Vibrio coralliilyticus]AXN34681.1 chemotaxis protein CheC [Vibrio coralliilyticus]KPH25126.1 chemotaxis protein CheC [Vibrio coralliilyticus]MCC2524404.1 chemotaxis protein CheC [Vibrio coralliilyticus]